MSVTAEANVQLRKWRKKSLRDRREVARFVRRASRSMGMTRVEWLEAYRDNDEEVVAEANMMGAALDIDIDRLREIFEMILAFFQALLTLFGGFGF